MANGDLENLVVLMYMQEYPIYCVIKAEKVKLEGFNIDSKNGTWSYLETKREIGTGVPYNSGEVQPVIIGVYNEKKDLHLDSMAADLKKTMKIKPSNLAEPVSAITS